ncbi:hypothetical protein DPMN_189399 [Dreissena polymorpha]|uniref:Uncharacterized protein n=1 Tax=Dreissena polymorpha TaxID=45954 RepID=A0A9D4ICA8_DREPO|nr:hypothetical protein DPMN_189399 [Dreissena polymorpha]
MKEGRNEGRKKEGRKAGRKERKRKEGREGRKEGKRKKEGKNGRNIFGLNNMPTTQQFLFKSCDS